MSSDIQAINNREKIYSRQVPSIKSTPIEAYWKAHPFELLTREQYFSLVVDIMERLPPNVVVHRLTGDGHRERLLAPLWPEDKRAVLNGVDKLVVKRKSWQGKLYELGKN